jgi:hypothetical protein
MWNRSPRHLSPFAFIPDTNNDITQDRITRERPSD